MLKKDIYRVCLVGALADISRAHVEAIKSLPQLTLAAVSDTDKEKLKRKYPDLPEEGLFDNYGLALDSGDFDIVVIATPNKLHSSMSVEALNKGKIVLCEKPMTHSMESAVKLSDTAENGAGLFVVSFHFRFFPEVRKFMEEREKFGKITGFRFVSSEYLGSGKDWILDRTQGGPWLDWASNALSVLRAVLSGKDLFESYFINKVKYVRQEGYEIELKAELDLILNGVCGNISVDWLAPEDTFVAKTLLSNDKGDEIMLDHAENEILVNGEFYWSGEDRRYIDVYEDLLARMEAGDSNIGTGMQDMRIIQAVRDWKEKGN